MTFVRDKPYAEARTDAPDDALPGKVAPYFLRAGEGPRHLLFGQVTFQLATGAETDGKVAMTVTEGPGGAETPDHRHLASTEGIYCLDGRLKVRIDGHETELIGGDFAAIPPNTTHGLTIASDFARFATMYGPAGPERLAELGGEVAEQKIFPPLGEVPGDGPGQAPQAAPSGRQTCGDAELSLRMAGGGFAGDAAEDQGVGEAAAVVDQVAPDQADGAGGVEAGDRGAGGGEDPRVLVVAGAAGGAGDAGPGLDRVDGVAGEGDEELGVAVEEGVLAGAR